MHFTPMIDKYKNCSLHPIDTSSSFIYYQIDYSSMHFQTCFMRSGWFMSSIWNGEFLWQFRVYTAAVDDWISNQINKRCGWALLFANAHTVDSNRMKLHPAQWTPNHNSANVEMIFGRAVWLVQRNVNRCVLRRSTSNSWQYVINSPPFRTKIHSQTNFPQFPPKQKHGQQARTHTLEPKHKRHSLSSRLMRYHRVSNENIHIAAATTAFEWLNECMYCDANAIVPF